MSTETLPKPTFNVGGPIATIAHGLNQITQQRRAEAEPITPAEVSVDLYAAVKGKNGTFELVNAGRVTRSPSFHSQRATRYSKKAGKLVGSDALASFALALEAWSSYRDDEIFEALRLTCEQEQASTTDAATLSQAVQVLVCLRAGIEIDKLSLPQHHLLERNQP
jgi:phage tail sheath protein FI